MMCCVQHLLPRREAGSRDGREVGIGADFEVVVVWPGLWRWCGIFASAGGARQMVALSPPGRNIKPVI